MPLIEMEKIRTNDSDIKFLHFMYQVYNSMNKIRNDAHFQKTYKNWIYKIVPFKSIALISFNPADEQHSIWDIQPAEFSFTVQQQLEDGIIQWLGENGKLYLSDIHDAGDDMNKRKIFLPLKQNDFYGGIIEIIPKKNNFTPDKRTELSLKMLGSILANHFELHRLREKVNESNLLLNRMSHRMDDVNHLALLGEISSGIVHQISNPMTTIMGRIGLTLYSEPNREKFKNDLSIAEREANKVSFILREFLSLAKFQIHHDENNKIQLNDVISTSLNLTNYFIRENKFDIETMYALNLPEIEANFTKLREAFCSLFVNIARIDHQNGRILFMTGRNGNSVYTEIQMNRVENLQELFAQLMNSVEATKPVPSHSEIDLLNCDKLFKENHGEMFVTVLAQDRFKITIKFPVKIE